MEHISEILKRAQKNTQNRNTDTWSSADAKENTPAPVCPICKGVGFVYPLLPSGKPDYSQVIPCRCARQKVDGERQTRLQRYSNLGSLSRFTFENLSPQGKSDNPVSQERFSRAYQAAKAFAIESKGWLVLAGPSGSGKTHLAAAIANYCIASNRPAFYITAPDLLDHLRSSFNPNSEMPYDEFFDQVRNTPLLILDDLGAQSSTAWAKEKLEQLLNHRYNNQIPTVIVSRVSVEELEERTCIRLTDSDFCQIYEIGRESAMPIYGWTSEFELEKNMTFENFDKRPNLSLDQRENLREALRVALDFAKSPDGWLVLWGDNGCGKTHLAAAIVNYRFKMKKPALFIVVPNFLDHLRSTFSPDSKISYDQLFESVKNAPLLVFDDFGKQTTTPWAQEKLYQVINYRYNAKLPTVITTNLSPDEVDSTIASRFRNSGIVNLFHIGVPDYFSGQTIQRRTSRTDRKES
jgi:DNA replication protein DnaC